MYGTLAFSVLRLMPTNRQWVDQMWASGEGIGLALTVGGIAYIFLGHSLYKTFTVVSYGFLGWWVSSAMLENYHVESAYAPLACLGVGAALAGITWPLAKHAASVLGGIVAGLIVLQLCAAADVFPRVAMILAGVIFLGVTALAFVRHDEIVVFACAAIGAVMLVSGVVALFGQIPTVGKHFRQLLTHYPIVIWMSFIAPIIIGMAVQLAMLKNQGKATLR